MSLSPIFVLMMVFFFLKFPGPGDDLVAPLLCLLDQALLLLNTVLPAHIEGTDHEEHEQAKHYSPDLGIDL